MKPTKILSADHRGVKYLHIADALADRLGVRKDRGPVSAACGCHHG